ncbi:MAG: Hsp20/alpha crystallin family protein [Planctomycetota bacterium]
MKATKSSQSEHPVEPKYRVPHSRCPDELEGRVFSPAVDIYETDDQFTVLADVPGASPEETDVWVDEDSMTVTARVQDAPGGECTTEEYPTGHWYRHFALSGIDTDEVEVVLQNGVLTVRLPKKGEAERRKIEIT